MVENLEKARGPIEGGREPMEQIALALSHPVRVRILGMTAESDLSPVEFSRTTGIPLHTAAYHFRELVKVGSLIEVDSIQRRGSREHIYAATSRMYFSDEEWEKLPLHRRTEMSKAMIESFLVGAAEALNDGTFDARADSHFSWFPADVDEQGWEELTQVANAALDAATKIKEAADLRLLRSGEKPIRTIYAGAAFETSRPSERASADG
jgi:DNA-binding transcriptional ArsR family regulator